MINNLDEAIAHAREKAEEQKKKAERNIIETTKEGWIRVYDGKEYNVCLECAREHEQLAEWLTELKELREAMEMIKKHYILVEKSPRDNPNEFMTGRVVPDNLQGWKYEEKENDK